MCAQNKENSRWKIPSSCGAKSLMRRKKEMEVEHKKIVGRGPLYVATHKKKNGEYTHLEAERICVEIEQEMTQNPRAFSDISTTDPVGKRHKSEHSGRVRCLGRGALPSVNLKLSRRKFRGTSVYEVGETSGSSNLEGALREIDLLKSIIKKIVPIGEYEKVFRETLQEEDEEEDDENDESSGGSNGQ